MQTHFVWTVEGPDNPFEALGCCQAAKAICKCKLRRPCALTTRTHPHLLLVLRQILTIVSNLRHTTNAHRPLHLQNKCKQR